jgi:Predicted ATPase
VSPVHPANEIHLVGNPTELARLDTLLELARSGVPVVAVVDGPAGIGKSTLLHWFRRRHGSVPATVVSGLAWERASSGALAERLLADGDPPAATGPAGVGEPVGLGVQLAARWAARAADAPLLVVVDDAHHADPVSLQAVLGGRAAPGGAAPPAAGPDRRPGG